MELEVVKEPFSVPVERCLRLCGEDNNVMSPIVSAAAFLLWKRGLLENDACVSTLPGVSLGAGFGREEGILPKPQSC